MAFEGARNSSMLAESMVEAPATSVPVPQLNRDAVKCYLHHDLEVQAQFIRVSEGKRWVALPSSWLWHNCRSMTQAGTG